MIFKHTLIALLWVGSTLVSWGTGAVALSNHTSPVCRSPHLFSEGIRHVDAPTAGRALPSEFELVCWNIEKGGNTGWKADLRRLARDSQLVLLQEAIYVEEMKQPREETLYWSFAPGYHNGRHQSGVMSVSWVQPDLFCLLEAVEPLLRSPKQTGVLSMPLEGSPVPLLVVNMHAINFTLGTKAFRRQLEAVGHIISGYPGPIVFAGDLNTWNQPRLKALKAFAETHALEAVEFEPDLRSQKMGHVVDYVFVRGLTVESRSVVPVKTSDHNPMIVTLRYAPDNSI
ncbi:endonuclease/exonuclease/phosphatase family protein [Coraliomargarita akajimensis]|uniref:Endonuclease/exonuclease/phosphatase n=1 Tax=Coraliomargarita akajimensis (strain DSM 45221 / IAM 15411 / JCM 23193 / KCTC 12865 / 04OKA010-24) TaxID=583355 RepID=D5EIN9_CORAD|nr:endonuclease/exonuclease/phosphatase family protein [Coraliomargarita akajimensis]ADE54288.1 Endonuclease/exonuclease/phosphatase [Coraliomargarita akajimensis DSM 45221]